MQGKPKVIALLNAALKEELTAINQYFLHAEMCENWHYAKLGDFIKKQSIDEMKHAEKLIARILFLEGIPIVSKLKAMHIGAEIPNQLNNDHALELDAIKAYNAAIVLAGEVGDFATCDLLEGILKQEDEHADEIEVFTAQISQMTLPVFLSTQTA